jgi:hypothetical protein
VNPSDLKKTADGINLTRGYSQKFDMPEYLDLGDFARQISSELPQNAAVQAAAAKILDSLNNANDGNLVIQNNTCGETMKKATGISIYFPEMREYSKDYRDLAFCKEYHWKDFLETFFVKSGGLG